MTGSPVQTSALRGQAREPDLLGTMKVCLRTLTPLSYAVASGSAQPLSSVCGVQRTQLACICMCLPKLSTFNAASQPHLWYEGML